MFDYLFLLHDHTTRPVAWKPSQIREDMREKTKYANYGSNDAFICPFSSVPVFESSLVSDNVQTCASGPHSQPCRAHALLPKCPKALPGAERRARS